MRRTRQVRLFARGQHHHRARVGQHEAQIGLPVAGIDRNRDRASLANREPAQRPVRHVAHHDRHPVARPDPVPDQDMREPAAGRMRAGEGERRSGEAKELPAGEPPGRRGDQFADCSPAPIRTRPSAVEQDAAHAATRNLHHPGRPAPSRCES
jgi:hypothetical protein